MTHEIEHHRWKATLAPKVMAHSKWWERGGTGDGRIEMFDQDLRGAAVRGLNGARFERCDLSEASISLLERIEVLDCTFDDAALWQSNWREATIKACRFRGARIGHGHFDNAVVQGGDWLGAYLERSTWTGARVESARFRASKLVDARLDAATFVECSFMDADFGRHERLLDLARAPKAKFVRCDFRGANLDGFRLNETVFDHCKFFEMTGKPDLEGPCTLIAPDFSAEGDGRTSNSGVPGMRDPDDVLRVWRDYDADRIRHWARRGDVIAYEPDRYYPERRKT